MIIPTKPTSAQPNACVLRAAQASYQEHSGCRCLNGKAARNVNACDDSHRLGQCCRPHLGDPARRSGRRPCAQKSNIANHSNKCHRRQKHRFIIDIYDPRNQCSSSSNINMVREYTILVTSNLPSPSSLNRTAAFRALPAAAPLVLTREVLGPALTSARCPASVLPFWQGSFP